MALFRKKPIVVQASQWHRNGDHPDDHSDRPDLGTGPSTREGLVVRYFRRPDVSGDKPCERCGRVMHDHGWIDTLEGGHIVCPGDWVITGVAGERYPCKDAIFRATYEPADEATS